MKTIDRPTVEKILQCNNSLLDDSKQGQFAFAEEHETCVNGNSESAPSNPKEKPMPQKVTHPQKSQQPSSVITKKQLFQKKLAEYEYKADQEGIYKNLPSCKNYITNFSLIEFLHRKKCEGKIVRVYRFDGVPIDLKPGDLTSQNSFKSKLLSCSSFTISLEKNDFGKFVQLLLELDDGKIVEQTTGFGQVTPEIFHLGNKVAIKGKFSAFQDTIWIRDKGFALNKTDMIKVSENGEELHNIWQYFHGLYGKLAILVIGFAVATLFYQQFLNSRKFFPLLYIRAASGRGKSCLAEFICSLFGLSESLATINCAGNSTKIGIETKSILLNNLPLVLNEAIGDNFSYMKSRYDGQGSIKYHQNKPGNIEQRNVNGPTIITTVVEPSDKQIVSRCVFIDLDQITMNKDLYDKIRAKIGQLSCFATEILRNVSFDDLLIKIDNFTRTIGKDVKEPRIIDNYSLLAGCFNVFSKLANDDSLPTEIEVQSYIASQMKTAERYLNPLIHFIIELERLADTPGAQSFIVQDDAFMFFNFNWVWCKIKDSYKQKHFPFMTAANIKDLLKNSDYIAVYGRDLAPRNEADLGEPITNYVKKINSVSKRCYVVKCDALPGFYR